MSSTQATFHLAGRKTLYTLNGLPKSFFNDVFHMLANNYFDTRLISGFAVFGVGWGLGGFCIGPVVTALPIAALKTIIFEVIMLIGMVTVKYFGLLCDWRAWDLVGKRKKIAVNSVTAG